MIPGSTEAAIAQVGTENRSTSHERSAVGASSGGTIGISSFTSGKERASIVINTMERLGPKSLRNSRKRRVRNGVFTARLNPLAIINVPSDKIRVKRALSRGNSGEANVSWTSFSASEIKITEINTTKISSVNRVKNLIRQLASVTAQIRSINPAQIPTQA